MAATLQKLRNCSTFVALLWVALLTTGTNVRAQDIPPGWVPFATPKSGSAAMACANYSEKEWSVAIPDGLPQITLASRSAGKRQPQEFPPGVKRLPDMKGRESKLKLQNGWLLGFDAGEFGGGLWFAMDDGSMIELSKQNVRGIVATPQGALILSGLAHMGLDSGKAFAVPNVVSSPRDLKTLVELDGAPVAFTATSDGSIIVATARGISRIGSSGSTETLLHRDLEILSPNSITVAPDGTIYVGMRFFVVRLVPHGGKHVEQWMAPEKCKKKFHVPWLDCSCYK